MSESSFKNVPKYELLRKIGKGKFGIVYLGLKIGSCITYAIKSNCRPSYKKFIRDEYLIMKAIVSPYVIRVFDYWEVGDTAYYSMEYTPHGDLLELLQKITFASKS